MQTTLQTRAYLPATATQAFDAFGALYGRLERSIFAAYCASGYDTKVVDKLKPKFCEEFGVTARQFNSCWALLKGKIASRVEVDKLALSDVTEALRSTRASVTKLLKQKKAHTSLQRRALDGKRRRLAVLEAKFHRLSDGKVRLCFGSKKLFRAQYDLTGNGYSGHEEWKAQWQEARSNTFFLVSSKDETHGNQSCKPTVASNGTLTLRIRMPDALQELNAGEKYLVLENVWFERGQVEIYDALDRGCAISFKFLRDHRGWRILCSIEREDYRPKFNPQLGVVGLDLNEDHLALTETDRFGNLKTVARVPCVMQGKTAEQRKAVAQHAAIAALAFAKRAGKPLALEKLNFGEKKKQLAVLKGDPSLSRRRRQLSSFGYSTVGQAIRGRALLEAVPVAEVNPAFTSVIGRIKYAKRLGVSVHQAAALAIGRRGMGYSETCPDRGSIPDGKGDHLIVEFPVRKRSAHAWSHWGKVSNAVQATLAEWHRLRKLAALEASQTAQAVQGAP